MKKRTIDEVRKKILSLWSTPPENLNVITGRDGSWEIEISNMYSAPGLAFRQLFELSKFFGTQNVNTDSSFSHGGCETCDYGSKYGFVIYIGEEEEEK